MTTPRLSFGIRGLGRHYPWPVQPTDHWPRNRWGSVDPDNVPGDVTPLPSVTNVLAVLDKPGLKGWAAEQAIRALYGLEALPWDVEIAVERCKYAFNQRAEERADVGTTAHTIAERLTRDLPLPSDLSDEDEAYADAYMKWWQDADPQVIAVEATVYHPEVGYAGTADLFAAVDGAVTVVDYKTRGKAPTQTNLRRYGLLYETNKMQLAALARATYLADLDEMGVDPAPEVVRALGVVLLPDGSYLTQTLEGAELERWYSSFVGAVQVWRGVRGVAA